MYARHELPTYGGAPAGGGLGFLQFATFAPVVGEVGGSAVSEIFSWGDTPDHDREQLWKWAQGVAANGSGICAQGKTSSGEVIRFNLPEVMQAVQWAPTGRPGDAPGSYEGLRTAIYQPMLTDGESKRIDVRPLLTSREATARLAVGVAHGRLDCNVGWQEEPAVVHLRRILDNYRNRPTSPVQAIQDTASSAVQTVGETVKPLAASIIPQTEDGKAAAIVVGMVAVGLLAAKLGGSF